MSKLNDIFDQRFVENVLNLKSVHNDHMSKFSIPDIDMKLESVSLKFVSKLIQIYDLEEDLIVGLKSNSDLLSGTYEGGFKIWEATKDIIKYIFDNSINLENGPNTIFDVGCGSGLVGISLLLNRNIVHFQDFNEQVLLWFTIPNIIINLKLINLVDPKEIYDFIKENCSFFSGDWSLIKKTDNIKYDSIFSSETIYNENNYEKLVNLITSVLDKEGAAFIGAKTYYFGVGGGTRAFEEYLISKSCLESEVATVIPSSVQREILKIKFK